MATLVILGLPGSGKSRLALAVADALWDAGRPAFVLHTDLLKVSLRECFPDELRGSGYSGDFRRKSERLRPFLETQAAKARRDGYGLVVEGTLALALLPEPGLRVVLEIDESERRRRIAAKHRSARQVLETQDTGALAEYAQALAALAGADVLRLPAQAPLSAGVGRILDAFLAFP
jgi:predicted kinase